MLHTYNKLSKTQNDVIFTIQYSNFTGSELRITKQYKRQYSIDSKMITE